MAKEIRLVETDVWSAIYVDGELLYDSPDCHIDVGIFVSRLKQKGITLEDFGDFQTLSMAGEDCEENSPPQKLSDLTADSPQEKP